MLETIANGVKTIANVAEKIGDTINGFYGLAGALEAVTDYCDEFINYFLDAPMYKLFAGVAAVILTLAVKRTVIQ